MILFRRFEFNIQWFLASIVCICALGAYVNLLLPQNTISIVGLLCIITGIIFCLSMFLLKSLKRSILFAAGFSVYLALRFLGLREWYFLLLLSITILSTDAYLVRLDKTRRV